MSMELDALIKAVTEEVMRRLQLPEKKMIIMGQDSEHTLRQCYLKEYQVSLYDRSESCPMIIIFFSGSCNRLMTSSVTAFMSASSSILI